jgi:23S rRNA pseudouridine1911/1915/1917 synthase
MIPLLYEDNRILVCVKPAGIVSTDEVGGLPQLLREQLGDPNACLRTVHRLDQVVGGVMVLARSRKAAQLLSQQVQQHDSFQKLYLAVTEGVISQSTGTLRDLLWRDKAQRKTLVVEQPGKDVQEAVLDYRVLATGASSTLVCIRLHTGRTHQIRTQFAHFGHPLVGDQKYGGAPQPAMEGIALWSHHLGFQHPQSGETMSFSALPPDAWPWAQFSKVLTQPVLWETI